MRVILFSAKQYDKEFFTKNNVNFKHTVEFVDVSLSEQTANLAAGYEVVCAFVNDELNKTVLEALHKHNVKLIALRCAGFNNIDIQAASELNLSVLRVPDYSPHAVAEHALALIQTLNRKTHRAFNRVREANFSLQGLLGFDLNTKTVGIVGTGKIGTVFAKIMHGIGCKVIACDPQKNRDYMQLSCPYVSMDNLLANSDIISLHCPLNADTKYMINTESIQKMKQDVMLINTGRGGLVDTKALIKALKTQKISSVGLDVYEEEADLFFEDNSDEPLQDEVFARLMTFPNVLITGHQGFFTDTALDKISITTLQSITHYENRGHCRGLPTCIVD